MHSCGKSIQAILMAGLLSLTACAGEGGERRVPVRTATAVAVQVPQTIAAIGSLEANEAIEVRAGDGGMVERIYVEEGAKVAAGTLLFEVDAVRAAARLRQAEAQYRLATQNMKRVRKLLEQGAAAQAEFDRVSADLSAATAARTLAEQALRDAKIEAPFAGRLGLRRISPGQHVSPGAVLTTLVDSDPVRATFAVPEHAVESVTPGTPFDVRVAAFHDEVFSGTVEFVSPTVEPETRNFTVRGRLPNADGRLRPGMLADVVVRLGRYDRAVAVPETALMRQGRETWVFVVEEENTVAQVGVEVRKRRDGNAIITSGLKPGQTVIVEGTQKVGPGESVVAQPATAAEESSAP